MQYAPVQQLLQMKNWLLGGGPFGNTGISTSDTAAPPAPARFLFEPVGDVYLLSGKASTTACMNSSNLQWPSFADVALMLTSVLSM